jgi:CBS domain-containing protein
MAHSERTQIGRRDGRGRFPDHPDQPEESGSSGEKREPATGLRDSENEPPWRSRSSGFLTPELDVPNRRYPPSGPGVAPGGGEGGQPIALQARPAGGDRRWFREPLTVADLMTREVRTVAPGTAMSEIAVLMREGDVGVVPVVDETSMLQGIVTDRDIVVRGVVSGSGGREPCARDLATKGVDAVSPRDSIPRVLDLMGRKQIRRVPVIAADGRLIGMISLADVAQRADYDREVQEALRHISARRSFWSRIWR